MRTVPYKVDPSLTIAIALLQRTTVLKFRQRLQSSNGQIRAVFTRMNRPVARKTGQDRRIASNAAQLQPDDR